MGALLIGSGTTSAALVGLAVGTALSWTPRAGIGIVAALAMAAVVADGIHMRTGRPSPWSVGRQVPVEWGRMFDPRVVAVLYGPRLGVGPLTMLSTWIWWAATIGAGLVGIAESVIVATVFGFVRLVVTATASDLADRTGHATWFARLRRRTTVAWWSLDGATMALMALVVVIAAACSSNTSIEAGPEEPSPDTITTTTNPGTDAVIEPDAGDGNEPGDDVDASTPTTGVFSESSLAETSAPLVTTADDIEPRPPAGPAALAAVLIDEVAGFEPVDDAEGDRQLSIDDAAQLQPDPTEELPLLETRGYQGGWTRAFRNDDNDVIVVTVYDFISELEADFYLEDGTITLIGDGSTIYEVEAIPGARGFEQQILDGVGEPLVVYGITFTNANQWFLVTILGDPATATPDRLLPAAVAQYQASRS